MNARILKLNTRSSEQALAAFVANKAEIDAMLARLQALSEDALRLQPRRDHLEPRRHPGALLRAPQAHHRLSLPRERARRVALPIFRPALRGPAAGARGRRRALALSEGGDHPMTRLSDTQIVILSTASQRDDSAVLPLPDSITLKGGALNKVMDSLRNRGLIHVIRTDDDRPDRLVLTREGMVAIGVEDDDEAPTSTETDIAAEAPAPSQ